MSIKFANAYSTRIPLWCKGNPLHVLRVLLNRCRDDGSGVYLEGAHFDRLCYDARMGAKYFMECLRKLERAGLAERYWERSRLAVKLLLPEKEVTVQEWQEYQEATRKGKGDKPSSSRRPKSMAKTDKRKSPKQKYGITEESFFCRAEPEIRAGSARNSGRFSQKFGLSSKDFSVLGGNIFSPYVLLHPNYKNNCCYTCIPAEPEEANKKISSEKEKLKTEKDWFSESSAAVSVAVTKEATACQKSLSSFSEAKESHSTGLLEKDLAVSDLPSGADKMSEEEKERKRLESVLRCQFEAGGMSLDRLMGEQSKLGVDRRGWLMLSFEEYLRATGVANKQVAEKKARSLQAGLIYALDGALLAKTKPKPSAPPQEPSVVIECPFKRGDRVRYAGRLGVVADAKPQRTNAGVGYPAEVTIDFDCDFDCGFDCETYVHTQVNHVEFAPDAPPPPDCKPATHRVGSVWRHKTSGAIYRVEAVAFGLPVVVDGQGEKISWSGFGPNSLDKICEPYSPSTAA